MKYHVNPKTQQVGQCKATKRPCAFGLPEEAHFTSKQEALEYYATTHGYKNLPQKLTRKTLAMKTPEGFPKLVRPEGIPDPEVHDLRADGIVQAHLREAVRNTSQEGVVAFATLYGDDSVYREVLKSPHASPPLLQRIEKTALNARTRALAEEKLKALGVSTPASGPAQEAPSPAVPGKGYSQEALVALANDGRRYEEFKAYVNSAMTEEEALAVVRNASTWSGARGVLLASPNPKITLKAKSAALVASPTFRPSQELVNDPVFPAARLVPVMTLEQQRTVAQYTTSTVTANALAKEVADRAAETSHSDPFRESVALQVARNTSLSVGGREYLAEQVPVVKSALKLGRLGVKQGTEFSRLPKPLQYEVLPQDGSGQLRYKFDQEGLKSLGVTSTDLNTFLVHFRNLRGGGVYNENTGVYTLFNV